MGATYNNYNGGADKAANTAITMANNECVARFNDKHPGETANCRMVAVGVVATPTTHSYSGEGFATASYWSDAWNKNIAPVKYHNNGASYDTDDGFSDAPERSVDSIAASLMVTTWALRWTTKMSTRSNTVIRPISAGHPHSGTVMSTKFPLELPAAINMLQCVLSVELAGRELTS